jgi:hypothetical protein
MKLKLFCLFVITYAIVSCQSDDEKPKGKYSDGVLVVNEGNFGAANASVTFYDTKTTSPEQAIFKTVNGYFPGDVLQSLTIDGDKGYLVLNGSNKIEVVNRHTFESLFTFSTEAMDKPRYMQMINGKAYISVWGPYSSTYDLIDSYILVVDLEKQIVLDTIDTDEGVEKLLFNGQRLFATNYNFGASQTLAIINPSTNELIDQIELAAGPSGLVLDADNYLWVICTGTYEGNDGKLFKINTTTLEIERTISLGLNPSSELAISPDKKFLFYRSDNNMYKLSIAAEGAPGTPWLTLTDVISPYGFNIDPASGDLYVGDAMTFSAGKVFVYAADGSFKTSFDSGIGPNGFVFVK